MRRASMILAAALVTFARTASAPAAGPASASASASASAEESKAPTPDEWKAGVETKLARTDKRCKAFKLREWMKIHCTFEVGGVAQLAGSPKGVATFVDKVTDQGKNGLGGQRGAEVILPLRKGDARYFEMFQFRMNYADFDWFTAVRISEEWSGAEPVVSVTYAKSN